MDAFATSSLTVCIGAMAVVGAVQDGIYGNYSILAAKAVLDLIIILVMTKGLHLLRHPCGGVPGAGHPAGRLCGTLLTEPALANLSLTGSIMIFCIGVNLIWNMKIRVANMLPTLLFAVLWDFLPWFT